MEWNKIVDVLAKQAACLDFVGPGPAYRITYNTYMLLHETVGRQGTAQNAEK